MSEVLNFAKNKLKLKILNTNFKVSVCNVHTHVYIYLNSEYILVHSSFMMTSTRSQQVRRQAFSVAGPTAWNSLADYLCDQSLSEDTFRRSLKTDLFVLY